MWCVVLTTLCVIAVGGVYGATVTPGQAVVHATLDENVMMSCTHEGSDDALEWVSDAGFGEMVIEDNPPFIITNAVVDNQFLTQLTIEGVTQEDATEYFCRSVDNPSDSATIELIVMSADNAPPSGWVPPKFQLTDGQRAIEIEVGKEMTLRCAGGIKDSNLDIHHNGDSITQDTHNVMTGAGDVNQVGSVLLLTRDPALTDYSGSYTCYDTDYPDTQDTVDVTVVDHPSTDVEMVEPSGTQTKVMLGDSFTLKCRFSSTTEVTWYHGDEELEDQTNNFLIMEMEDTATSTRTSVLTKEGADHDDAGTYSCVNAHSDDKQASIDVAVKSDGDSGFLDDLFGAAPYVTSSLMVLGVGLLAALMY